MASSSAYWGSSAVHFLKNTAQIVASVAVATVGVYLIVELGSPLFGVDLGAALSNFISGIPSYAEQGFDALKGFWADLNAADGLITQGVEATKQAWHTSPYFKGGAAVAGVAVGAYALGSAMDSWRDRVRANEAQAATRARSV